MKIFCLFMLRYVKRDDDYDGFHDDFDDDFEDDYDGFDDDYEDDCDDFGGDPSPLPRRHKKIFSLFTSCYLILKVE